MVNPSDKTEVDNFCRVLLAIKNGKSTNMGKRMRIDGLAGAVLVALDVESDGFPPFAPLLEVGGAAFYWATEEVEGTFCELARGVREVEGSSCSIVGKLTGLEATDESNGSKAQNELKVKTKKWFKGINGRKIILSWGSCDDASAVGLTSSDGVTDTIDLHSVYVKWLALNGIARKGSTKLQDAVEHLCPDFPVRYHSAFDDVVATIFVANSILEFAGAL